jgi:ABC-type transport system involved in multi-copper enzyme maturation permease subunit
MNTLPVIERELRMRARQGATYWARCGVAAMAGLIGIQEMVLTSSSPAPTAVGPATFQAVSWLGFLIACICSLVSADSLSRERREGTLGLLLLTELKSRDVVFGKLCAAGLTACYALIGFLPAMAIVVLAGGVTGGQVFRTSLALLNTVIIALAAGIWVSGRTQSRHKALRGALLIVLLLCILPRIAMNIGSAFTYKAAILACFSPYSSFYMAPDNVYLGAPRQYWYSLIFTQLEAWLLFEWTALRLFKNWQSLEWSPPRPKVVVWEPLLPQEVEALATSRAVLLEEDPVCWAVSRMRIQNALIWTGTLLLLLGGTGFSWGSLIAGARGGPLAMGLWDSLHLVVSLGSAALLAWAAGRFFFEKQRNGELEMLLSTPLGARDIVGGNWRALCKPLRGAWLLVGFLILFELISGSVENGLFTFQRAIAPIVRVLDIMALCWMGMWFGLRARKPSHIMGWTVGMVVALPWVISFVFIVGTSLTSTAFLSPGAAYSASSALLFWFAIWPLLNVAKNIFFIRWAGQKLRAELRTKAALAAGDWLK